MKKKKRKTIDWCIETIDFLCAYIETMSLGCCVSDQVVIA